LLNFLAGIFCGFIVCTAIAAVWTISAFRRLNELQRRTREAERLAELGTLTGGLAHEIKNPLSTVQLNLQLLAEDVSAEHSGSARLTNRLETVQRETGRLREILEDFLRYAGRMELDRRPVDLNVIVEDLCDFFSPQAQLQRTQLRVRKAPEPVVMDLDVKLINQGILNLMINALQAMPDGGELMLAIEATADTARIDVTDTGPGIPAEVLGKIFQAYYSTKRGGNGLGLALTRRIAREHGGELTVESVPGKGTKFTIQLPRTATPRVPPPEPRS